MSAPFLSLDWLNVSIGKQRVVEDVTVHFVKSSLVALVGPNGAGKSSLLRAIAGLMPMTGSVSLGGMQVQSISRQKRARLIGYLPQGHQTHWPLPVRDIVALGRFPHGLTDPSKLTGAHAEAVESAMQRAGVTDLADRPATQLSGGEKARVALARVLALGAPLILADEPTASLDPRYQLEVMTLLKTISQQGALVIAVTHDLGHAAHFADQVVVMNAGKVVTSGTPGEALSPKILEEVFRVKALSDTRHGNRLLVPWEVVP